jgi:thiamine kinase-like enzyme
MTVDEETARRTLAALPAFPADALATARIQRLGGLTNHVFKVETRSGDYALRLPRAIANAIIDREAERNSAEAAAKAGVTPEMLFLGDDGVMLTRFVVGARPVVPEQLRRDPALLDRVAATFCRLHRTAPPFGRDFRVFAIADFYRRVLGERGVRLSPAQQAVGALAEPIRAAFAAAPAELRPCHCDPTCTNLLDDGERIWLVDWEYAGNNDPMWDLAYLSNEAGFSEEDDTRLLGAYCARAPLPQERARMALNKPLCDLLGGLWALIQHAAGNGAADFARMAELSFARAGDRLGAAEVARHIAALQAPVNGGAGMLAE